MSDEIVDFGDDDPEDGWDAGDPIHVKVEVLRRTVVSIENEGHTPRFQNRRLDGLRLFQGVLDEMDATPHDQSDSEVRMLMQRLAAL